jgi:hypothetical protein
MMRRIDEGEVLWNKIMKKHIACVVDFKNLGERTLLLHTEMRDLLTKIKGYNEAAIGMRLLDEKGNDVSAINWKRLEPVYKYFSEFITRQVEFHGSPAMLEFGKNVRHDFIRRIGEVNTRIHSNNLAPSHAVKLLMPYEKELDGFINKLNEYEKEYEEAASEFADIKRVAALEEN